MVIAGRLGELNNINMTESIDFIERLKCEICGGLKYDILTSKLFTDGAVFDFIKNYYQGRVPESFLENKKFEVRKCKKCGFVWQGYVLDDAGMGELYNKWISEEESLKKSKNGEPVRTKKAFWKLANFFKNQKKI